MITHMKITLSSPQELGRVVRATRKAARLRQDDAAGAIGVSDVFLGRLENGAPGARLDKVLQVLRELGIDVYADVTEPVAATYRALASATQRPSRRSAKPKP